MQSFRSSSRRTQFVVFALAVLGASGFADAAVFSVGGTPQTTVNAGQAFSFQPTVSGSTTSYMRFSVTNKPGWLQFNSATGALQGTPGSSNVGVYPQIVIRAYARHHQTSLPAFSITVKDSDTSSAPTNPVNVAPVNTPPAISGSPLTTDIVGKAYLFTPVASDANGDALSFIVANKPIWARFDASTGTLTGTPTAAGQFANVMISVSDGKSSASLPVFTIAVTAPVLGTATMAWIPPTQNTDGSPLTTLAGYHILYGTNPDNLTETLDVLGATIASVQIEDLTPGTYYFAARSYTQAGLESDVSQVVWKTIQ